MQPERMRRECLTETWGCEESTERGCHSGNSQCPYKKAQAQERARTAGVRTPKAGGKLQDPRPEGFESGFLQLTKGAPRSLSSGVKPRPGQATLKERFRTVHHKSLWTPAAADREHASH